MKAVVHFGMSKTGSTAIQKSLMAARDQLLEAGVLYPRLTSQPHHTYLLPAVSGDDRWKREYGPDTPANREKMQNTSAMAWDRLAEEITTTQAETVIVSSEHLLGASSAALRAFHDRLSAHVSEIRYSGYLRSPASHYLSSVQQALKFSDEIKPPATDLQFRPKLRKIASVSQGNWQIAPFDRDTLEGNCVVRDFLSRAVGLGPEILDRIRRIDDNTSISAEGMALMQEWNRHVWGGKVPFGNALNKRMLRLIQFEEEKHGYGRPVLRPEISAIVNAANSRDVAWLQETHGVHLKTTAAAQDVPVPDLPDRPLQVQDICQVDPAALDALRIRLMKKMLQHMAPG